MIKGLFEMEDHGRTSSNRQNRLNYSIHNLFTKLKIQLIVFGFRLNSANVVRRFMPPSSYISPTI